MKPEDSVKLLAQCLDKEEGVDATILHQPPKEFNEKLLILFESFHALPNWESARDIQIITTKILVRVANSATPPTERLHVDEGDVLETVKEMLEEKVNHGESVSSSTGVLKDSLPTATADFEFDKEPPFDTDIATPVESNQTNALPELPEIEKDETETRKENKRDFGVSDTDWEQLQCDQRKAEKKEQEYERLKDSIRGLRHQIGVQGDKSDDSRATLIDIEANLAKLEEQRGRERKNAEILRHMGRCQYGNQWIKQTGGYRCEGGLHWVLDREVEARVNL